MKNRILAIILSLITVLSAVVLPVQAKKESAEESYKIINVFEDGYSMPNLGDMIQRIRVLNDVMFQLTGLECFSNEVFDLGVDSMLQGVVDYIKDYCGLDFSRIYKFLPQTNQYAQWITTTFQIDTVELQNQLNDKSAELKEQGKLFQMYLVRWISVWMGIIDKCELQCIPVEGEDEIYQIVAVVTYSDGRTDTMASTIYYNADTKEFTGKDGKDAFLGFDMDVENVMTYTGVNVWQRKVGFCLAYDLFCYSTVFMNYETQRFKFNYDNQEWMIQIWKGRYLIANGGEVGIYNREIGSKGSWYNCAGDDDMMEMSLDIYHGDKLILHREPTLHWWITGFAPGDTAYLPCTLTMITTITMKDEEMLRAFTEALDKKSIVIDYETDGLNVTIEW